MDMAVANLFKHKIRFTLEGAYTEIYEPRCFRRRLYYESPRIESVESLGINNVNYLFTVHCKPLTLYVLSKIVHQYHVIPIDRVIITVGVVDFHFIVNHDLKSYRFDNPLEYPELFFTHTDVDSYSFPERLFKERTHIFVEAYCYYYCDSPREEARFRREFNFNIHRYHAISVDEYLGTTNFDNEMSDGWQEEESDEEELYIPPVEPFRENDCVACLVKKPNILYLDCLHMVICDSCDHLKKTGRKNCDVCRSEISRRIAL